MTRRVAALRSTGAPAPVRDDRGARRVEAMVARHGPALLRVANQFSLCHDDALDAYQRALEIYLRRLETVDPATEGAWMRVVVKHEAMAVRRARQQSVDHDDVDLDASVPAGLRDVDDQVAGGERVERSVEALRALKPDEAKALMLKAQGLSYQEIGRRFGWTYTKVNRSITEGRARFMKAYRGIEEGEACERHVDALAALAYGTATSAQVVALRPHLRHCAACRATVRELRLSRRRRIALLLPLPGLQWAAARVAQMLTRADVGGGVQLASASGGGRLGAAAALLGVCLGGVGAGAACVMSGAVQPALPILAHQAASAHHPRPHARRPHRSEHPRIAEKSPRATLAAAATPTPPPPRATATPAHRAPAPHATKKPAPRDEFGFEDKAASTSGGGSASSASGPVASKASVGGAAGSRTSGAPAGSGGTGASGKEFGFEGG